MKNCGDCKYQRNGWCWHPKNNPSGIKPIDCCSSERMGPEILCILFGQCGPSGRFFEVKEK